MFKHNIKKAISIIVLALMVENIIMGFTNYGIVKAAENVYYVDNLNGDDKNIGTDIKKPWKTLQKVNSTVFSPGDKILFKAGGSWNGQLWPKGSGRSGSPIIIDMYGEGNKPLIAGVKNELQTVFLKNQEYWEINNLEVTNPHSYPFKNKKRGERRGVYILNEECGILHHIHIKNLNVHDVDGIYTTRSGGIIIDSVGSNTPSAFDDIIIDGNTLTDVDAYGIYISSNCILRYGMSDLWPWVPKPYGPWTPSTNVKISNNTIVRPATGGIAWNVTDGAIVERNTVQEATYLATNASIWWAYADNNIVQFNESFGSHNGTEDGEGFDVDAGNLGSLVQYNYSHDNAGGFMLFVNDTYYTTNTVVRYNISQNDRRSIYRYSGSINNVINYNNTVYVGKESQNPVMSDYFTKASGYPHNIMNYNNVYYSEGDKGWDLRGQTFDYNAYYGGKTLVNADTHKVTANPNLKNPGSGSNGMDTVSGYELQENSPLIGAGVPIKDNGGRDYFGNPLYNGDPDIGAHEYQGTVPETTNKTPVEFNLLPYNLAPASENLAPLAVATTTFAGINYPISNINDSNYETSWCSNTEITFPNYITLDFGVNEVTANNLKLNTRFGETQGITNFDIECSDGTTWSAIKMGIDFDWKYSNGIDEIQSVDFDTTTFKKLRLKVNAGSDTLSNIAINELGLYNIDGKTNAAPKAAVSTTFPTGLGLISNINDGNISKVKPWASSTKIKFPQYITFDFGSYSVNTDKISLFTHFGGGQGITNLDIEYFDGEDWKTAASNVDIKWLSNNDKIEVKHIEFEPINTNKIRLKVNDGNHKWGNITLTEVQIFVSQLF